MRCFFGCPVVYLKVFIRKKKNKSGTICVQIIDKSSGTYKVIQTFGSSSNQQTIDKYYKQAQETLPRLFNQLYLFDKPPPIIDLQELSNDNIRVVGPELIFGRIFDFIGFNKIPDQLFKDLAISRITHPGSKLKLAEYLRENNKRELSVDSIYYFLDKLNKKYKHQIEDISFAYTQRLLGGKIGIVFYDMTTIYFESSKPDDFRITGFSKDGKHQHPQIFLGLLIGKNGYPIGYDIFEGNIYEGNTLIPVLERFENRFLLEKPIVVADAGLLSNKNIEALKKNHYKFILGARIRNESKEIKKQILGLNYYNNKIYKINKNDQTLLFLSYSSKRAAKDQANRNRGLKRLQKSLNTGKLTKSNINNRGYNKYLKMKGELKIEIDYDKFQSDAKWDGLKGYITNTSLSGSEVIDSYNNLWKIERAFRISKTDLKIRPIYHRLRERIEAHICISFVSYVLYKELERVLLINSNISIGKAINEIKKMYEIYVPTSNSYRSIKLKNNPIQKQILEAIQSDF